LGIIRLRMVFNIVSTLLFIFIGGCVSVQPKPSVHYGSVAPGSVVSRGDKKIPLFGTPVSVGKALPSVNLVDAMTMENVDLRLEKGKVLFLSIVPSLDTPVCEAQTHYLAEEGDKLPKDVQRITISRDTPFAQKRFAEEAKLMDIQYLSDYKRGAFGRSTGLLMDGLEILARSVILVDKSGLIRYIQVVPEITNMPDMERAFQEAINLVKEY